MKWTGILVILLSAIAPALAADDCAKWRFGKIPMEEGTAPAALICTNGEDGSLMLSCAGDDMFWMRYYPAAGGPERQPGYEGRFVIDIGDDTFRRKAMLEAMDNAIVIADQKLGGPLLAGMMSGGSMKIAPDDGSAKADVFTLSGSTAAIKSLAAACGKIGN